MKEPLILGIESSCDDTSVAVLCGNRVLSNIAANQEVHMAFGGVVPELASRAHQMNILPVVHEAVLKAKINKNDIDAIAITRGPGLVGSLVVGLSFAKSLSQAWNIPLVEVNHLKAHILAHFIADANPAPPPFPFLCLTVSGGHTMIVKVNNTDDFEVMGKTLDDAAGEAFDKAGKILGLDYPAGVHIDRLAKSGNPDAFTFGKPKLEGYDFSFSGLKTSILYQIQKRTREQPDFISENLNDLCASIQKTIVDILLHNLYRAAKDSGISHLAIAGGVSANSHLREKLTKLCYQNAWKAYIPKFEYTTDNAAMIAMAGYFDFQKQKFADISITPLAKHPI